jgi:hypothetical protein
LVLIFAKLAPLRPDIFDLANDSKSFVEIAERISFFKD